MTKFATIAFAAAMAAVTLGATGAKASPYEQDHLIQGIANNQIEQAFGHQDQAVLDRRVAYLAGFTQWYDARCDFLAMPIFEGVRNAVTNLNNAGHGEITQIGMRDARTFLGEEGCATRTAQAARASLTAFWEGAIRQHQRPQNPGQGAGQPGGRQPGAVQPGRGPQGLERQARY
ncbi:hypothetical protein [Phreatobacter sp.]|uniref:hypothetical protein n=1 Tax=Phreatobacter sp. TaxID=1966341 RepID=UPI003F70FD4B